jgi:predicted transcriptional regulator of viral defense system
MKYSDFRKKVKEPVFSRQDLKLLGLKVFDYQLSLWQKQGYLVKLKNGLYALAETVASLRPEEIAGQLHAPSYISLEKALSIYGIIPEMVYSITCITPKTTRRYKNTIGNFEYHHVKESLFFGYKTIQGKNCPYLLAEPEKAWLDFIYFHLSEMGTKEDFLERRINLKALREMISKDKLKKYIARFGSKKMLDINRKVANII